MMENYTKATEPNTEIVGAKLITYFEIFYELATQFFSSDCSVWAQPIWLENTITILVVLATVFYIYVIIVIVSNIRQIRSAFYFCALSLAVGDLVIMISGIREGRMQTCVLKKDPERHYAWQTIGTFGMDCTVTSQLVMAVTRFTAIYTMPREEISRRVAKIGIMLSWLWTIVMTIVCHFGLITRIWFKDCIHYRDEFRVPFMQIRIFLLFLCIVGAFLIYLALLILTIHIRHQAKRADLQREISMFIQCILIFFCELGFLNVNFHFTKKYLGWGNAAFNANLRYVLRPLSVALTPVIYMVFSTNLRQMMLKPIPFFNKTVSKNITLSSDLANKQPNGNGGGCSNKTGDAMEMATVKNDT